MSKKIGLLGGAFDPIHNSHISMALRLKNALGLDGVVLMPTYAAPHKMSGGIASADHRLAMCRLAAEGIDGITVSDAEIRRGGVSFMADTLAALEKEHPDTAWYLLLGADAFCHAENWFLFDEVARRAVLCTVPRAGTDGEELRRQAEKFAAAGVRCYVDTAPVQPISATDIRRRIAAGEPLTGLVPAAVERYIAEHGLYRADFCAQKPYTTDEDYTALIRARLSDYRFRHSLCVSEEAVRLAKKYGADADKARTAGLLHDVMKDTDKKVQLQIMHKFGILLDEVEKAVPKLWHARSGEAFLGGILGFEDEDILSAIRYHTTGRAEMELLEKVLFVADFTSADRDYPDVDVMRRLCDESLEAAMEYGIAYTIRDLLEQGQPVHPDTLAAYNALILRK